MLHAFVGKEIRNQEGRKEGRKEAAVVTAMHAACFRPFFQRLARNSVIAVGCCRTPSFLPSFSQLTRSLTHSLTALTVVLTD